MSDDTQPITPPVTWAKGRWMCHLCDAAGPGGTRGFNEHYAGFHGRSN